MKKFTNRLTGDYSLTEENRFIMIKTEIYRREELPMTFLLAFALLGLSGFSFYKADELELVLFQKIPINLETAGWILAVLGVVLLLVALEDEGIDLWDIGSQIIMFPFYLITGILSFAIEYWWVLLIGAVLLWPKLSGHFEFGDIFAPRELILQGQENASLQETEAVCDPSRPLYNTGVCKTLAEDTHFVVLFLNDDHSSWSEDEMKNYLREAVEPGLSFIRTQGSNYGFDLELDYSYHVTPEGKPRAVTYSGVVVDTESGAINDDIMEQCAQQLGFESKWDMLEKDRTDAGKEQIGYITCVNKYGRSFANCVMAGMSTEYAMLFNKIPVQWERANGVAHEVMHLFGAEDMYAEGSRNVNRAKLAQQYHPYEVMLKPTWGLVYNTVSPYTAYAVGWRDTLPPEYDCPEWWS